MPHICVQFSSVAQSCLTLCEPMIAARQASLSITIPQSSLRLMSIEYVMQSSHLILNHPLLLLPPIPPSIRDFSNESTLHMVWPKYWSFSFSIIPSKEIPGLISFRMDWLDLLAVQETLKSFLQYHSLKASILWCSAFFTVQLSHPYMTTGKTIALTRRTLVSRVMSPLLNMLSRLVITFLPRSKRLLFSWLQSPSAMILEPPKNKVWHCFHCFSIYFPWSDRTGCHDLRFWMLSFKPTFSLSSFSFIKKLFSSSSLSAIRVVSSIGDWNAKVGSQETPGVTGKFGLGIWNEARQRLIEFCQENALVIANTLFQQHKRRLYTWTSPDGQHQNQIDYILCSQRWRSCIQSFVLRGH